MRKQDDVADAPRGRARGALALLWISWIVAGCLNPRPEDYPSNTSAEPAVATEGAPDSDDGARASGPGADNLADPQGAGTTAAPEPEPAPASTPPPLEAPPPQDAGVGEPDAGPVSDAG